MKNLQLFICLCIAVFSLTVPPAGAQSESTLIIREESGPDAIELLKWDETFRYEIRYSFFKLGEATVTVSDTVYKEQPAWHLQGIITSAPGIPFVGREENHYNSIFRIVDGKAIELVYWKDDIDDDSLNEDRYLFDYEVDSVYAFKEGEPVDTLYLEQPATSGPLIFFFSRLSAGQQKDSRIFIYLDEEMGTIDMKYTRERQDRSYKAFEQPVRTFFSSGHADINGPFGFRGDFKAWFANDELRIPLEAHVKVWLGNVKVRLIDYKKELRNEESTF